MARRKHGPGKALLGTGIALGAWAQAAYAHVKEALEANLWREWNFTPLIVIATLLAAAWYLAGLKRYRRLPHPVTGWQRASFFAGLAAVFLALQSPIDFMAEHLFFMHQVQHMLLRMIGPILILLSAPLAPILKGMPRWARHGLVKPIAANPGVQGLYRFLMHPTVAPAVFVGALAVWQIPRFHNLALLDQGVHDWMHVTMLLSGLFFWWLVLDPRGAPLRPTSGLRIVILALIMLPNTLLGAYITLTSHVLYSAYGEVGLLWHFSALVDQQWGGLILWIPGDMMSVIAAGIVFLRWYRSEGGPRQAATPGHGLEVSPQDLDGG